MQIICIINDHPAHLALMIVHLLKLDYPVVACPSALAADFLQHIQPDIIFFQVEPPAEPEIGALSALRGGLKRPDTPILVLSPTVQSDLAEKVLDAGADAVYPNPKDMAQLSALLRQYLDTTLD